MSIFDKWTDLDPALALKRIEEAHGSAIFTKYSYLDPQLAVVEIENALGIDLDNTALDFAQLEDDIDAAVGDDYIDAVRFPDCVSLVQKTSSVADSPLFSLHMIARWPASSIALFPALFSTSNSSGAGFASFKSFLMVGWNHSTDLGGVFKNTDSTHTTSFGSADGLIQPDTYYDIFLSVDTNHAASARIVNLDSGAVDVINHSEDFQSGTAYSIGFDGKDIFFTERALAPTLDIKMIQAWCGTYIEPTPENLAALASPSDAAIAFGEQTFLFTGNKTQFVTNQGSAGACSVIYSANLLPDGNYLTGLNGAGSITLPGTVAAGTSVIRVYDTTNNVDVSDSFESTISVDGQVQQISSDDLSSSQLVLECSGSIANAPA